jgi:hypothetical protein
MQGDGAGADAINAATSDPPYPPCNKEQSSPKRWVHGVEDEFSAIGRPHHLPDAKQLAAYLARAAFH